MEEITLQDLDECMQNFNKTSSASYNEAVKWKNKVLSNQKNLFQLLNYFTSNVMQTNFQYFILELIQEFIRCYSKTLPLHEITSILSSTPEEVISNASIVTKLGEIIGEITKIVYQNEDLFLFPPSEVPSPNHLVAEIYSSFFLYMEKPQENLNQENYQTFLKKFQDEILFQIWEYAIQALDDSPEIGVQIMKSCIFFNHLNQALHYHFASFLIEPFTSEDFFMKLFQISVEIAPNTSNDIIDCICKIIKALDFSNISLIFSNLGTFIISILNETTFFDEQQNIQSFCNLISSVDISQVSKSESDLWNNVIGRLIELINSLSNFENYLSYYQILSNSCDLLCNYQKYQITSNNFPYQKDIQELLSLFIQTTFNSFENDYQATWELLEINSSHELKLLLQHLWILANDSAQIVLRHYIKVLNKLSQSEITPALSCEIYLIFRLICVAMINKKTSNAYEELKLPVLHSVFLFLHYSSLQLPLFREISDENTEFPPVFEKAVLSFLTLFCNNYFNNKLLITPIAFPLLTIHDSSDQDIFEMVPPIIQTTENMPNSNSQNNNSISSSISSTISISKSNNNNHSLIDKEGETIQENIDENENIQQSFIQEKVAYFIFNRIWNDLNYNIYLHKAKKTMRKILWINGFLHCLMRTDLPTFFLMHYLEMPVSSITYNILGTLVCNTQYRDGLIQSIFENFSEKDDIESMRLLMKLFCGLFQSLVEESDWIYLYVFFYDNFRDKNLEISKNKSFWPIIISFILSLFNTRKGQNNKYFKSWKPHSLQLVQFIFQLLTNLSNILIEELTPINVDDSIFQAAWDVRKYDEEQCNDSPISLSELQNIPISRSSPKMALLNEDDISEPIPKSVDDDSEWIWVPRLIQAIINLMCSPFPNFGIMEMYNDRSFYILFEKIIEILGKTSPYSILAIPSLQQQLTDYLWIMMHYFSEGIISTPQYWQFILDITRILFLSHLPSVLYKISLILTKSVKTIIQISDHDQLISLRPHFVLTLNLISLQIMTLNRLTLFAFQYAKYDKEFAIDIGVKISSAISDIYIGTNFLEEYGNLLKLPFPDSPEKEDMIIEKFREYFKLLPIRPMNVSELAEYFNFENSV